MLSDKLAYTAAMFINVELLSEFYFDMPRELEQVLYYGVRGDDVRAFAMENKEVARHLECLKRTEVLKLVLAKLKDMKSK